MLFYVWQAAALWVGVLGQASFSAITQGRRGCGRGRGRVGVGVDVGVVGLGMGVGVGLGMGVVEWWV